MRAEKCGVAVASAHGGPENPLRHDFLRMMAANSKRRSRLVNVQPPQPGRQPRCNQKPIQHRLPPARQYVPQERPRRDYSNDVKG